MAVRSEPNAEPIPGYRLIDRLGSGGYGEVWRAEAPGGLHKAIKLVHGKVHAPKAGSGSDQISHVERELKGLSRVKDIRHPFILTMERYDIVDDRLLIVMELADRDLGDRMRECRDQGLPGIPRTELLDYLKEVAEALDTLNFEHDVQHLDIKPTNVFLVGRHVKVADFGLAKALEGVAANVTSGMTPTYAAPETFNGTATRFTDQYSLAVMYQELLTGTLPFAGPGPPQFMLQHLTKEPDLSPLPANDRPIVSKALNKDPDKRYTKCSEFIGLLFQADFSTGQLPRGGTTATRSLAGAEASTAPIGMHAQASALGSATVIGIDLGTSNSVVALAEGDQVKVIVNQEGHRLTPSVVAFDEEGGRVIGEPAKRQAATNPTRTIASIKRFMGRRHSEVQAEEKLVPYTVVGQAEELVRVKVGEKELSPPEISAQVLRKLKTAAEDYLGHEVADAVITVPAYFNDSQRQATKEAGYIGGLEVRRIVNEPTAAALAYGIQTNKNQRIAVFDFGGGTFDITVLRVHEGIFDVLATNGDTHLGGDDITAELVRHLATTFEQQHGVDPCAEPSSLQRLIEAAEQAKVELSSRAKTDVNLPFLIADASGPKHLAATLTRAQLEQMVGHLIDRCREPCDRALADAGLGTGQIEEVILVGGTTRMPAVRRFVKEYFGREPNQGLNPDEAIAIGAAIQAEMLSGRMEENLLLDVTPLSLGVEARGGVMAALIERNTTVPTVKREVFTTARDGQTEVGIHVLQGEREFAKDNRTLGKFWLGGIQPAPVGTPQIEVTFNIDANGILDVSAKDLSSGNLQSLVVQSSSGLSPVEIERMRAEADQFAAEDQNHRDLLEVRGSAEAAIAEAEKFIKVNQWAAVAEKEKVLKAIEGLRKTMEGQDPLAMTTEVWRLQQSIREVASRSHEPEQAQPAVKAGRLPGPSRRQLR